MFIYKEEFIRKIQKKISQSIFFLKSRNKYNKKLQISLERSLYFELNDFWLIDFLIFNKVAKKNVGKNIFILKKNPFSKIILNNFNREKNFDKLILFNDFSYLKNFIKTFLGSIKLIIKNFFFLFIKINKSKKSNHLVPKIGIQLKCNLNEIKKFTDISWINEKKINKENVILYTTKETLDKKNEYNLINLKNWSPNFKILNFIKTNFLDLLASVSFLLKNSKKNYFLSLWSSTIFLDFFKIYNKWFFFFRENNIKVHLQRPETDIFVSASHLAIDHCNGLEISHQFAGSHFLRKTLSTPRPKIFISWGKHFYHELKKIKNSDPKKAPDLIFYTGYKSNFLPREFKSIEKLKKKYNPTKTKVLVSVFPDSIENRSYLYSKNHLLSFYKHIIEILKDRNDITFLLKPKNDVPFFYNVLKNEYSKFIKKKKLFILKPNISVEQINSITDFSITFGFGSAGIECESIGKRNIFYLPIKLSDNPFYKYKLKYLISNNKESLVKCIDSCSKKVLPINDLKEQKKLRNNLNCFGDLDGHKRFSEIIYKIYKTFLTNNLSKDVLNKCIRFYKKKYGPNNVIKL